MNETRELASWLTGLQFSDLPENVVDFTKRFLLDDIGCMLGGSLQLGNKAVMQDVMTLGERPESTIAVYGHKTSAPSAALVNGAFICGWDYDDLTLTGAHMGSQTAALLAMAEREIPNGKEMIAAECAGIEAQAHLGAAAAIRAHPWHSNTTFGPFAAAVATGKILGFDAELMENAIAIAACSGGGNYQHYFGWGSNMKRIRCGIGAWFGVRAALLAREGLTGPKEVLEGKKGYLEAISGRKDDDAPFFDASLLTEGLGEKWAVLTYRSKAGGPRCVTSLTTPTLTAGYVKDKYDFEPEDIESVVVEFCNWHGIEQSGINLGTMMGMTPAQRLGTGGWCRRWMVAEALVVGLPTIRKQLDNIRPYGRYRVIEALSEKVEGRVNEEYYREHFKGRPYPSRSGGRIIVKLKDGKVIDQEPIPNPGCMMSDGTINFMTVEQLEVKLREQADPAGLSKEKQDRIIEFVAHMEDQRDILSLIPNLVR